MENSKPNSAEEAGNNKQEAFNADKTDMLQHEKLIDPGNEHSHHVDDQEKPAGTKGARFDAEAGDDKADPKTKTE